MKTLRSIEVGCGLMLWPALHCSALYLCYAELNAHMAVLGPQKDVQYMACVQNGSYGHMCVHE